MLKKTAGRSFAPAEAGSWSRELVAALTVRIRRARQSGLLLNLASLTAAGVVCLVVWQQRGDPRPVAPLSLSTPALESGQQRSIAVPYDEGADNLGDLAELYRDHERERLSRPRDVFLVATDEEAALVSAFLETARSNRDASQQPAAVVVIVTKSDDEAAQIEQAINAAQIRHVEAVPLLQFVDLRRCPAGRDLACGKPES